MRKIHGILTVVVILVFCTQVAAQSPERPKLTKENDVLGLDLIGIGLNNLNKMSRIEFGKFVKMRLPQYSDLSDERVTALALDTFPQYYDIVNLNITSAKKPLPPVASEPQQENTPGNTKMNKIEFARMFKEEYPQYFEIPDELLAAKALETFPQLRDMVKPDDIAAGGTEEEAVKAYENAVTMMDYAKAGVRQLLRVIVSPLTLILSIPVLYFIKRRRQKQQRDKDIDTSD